MFCWLNVLIDKLQHKCHLEEKLTSHADLVQRMWDEYEEKRIMAAAEARDTLPAVEWIGLLLMMSLMWITMLIMYFNHQRCARRKRNSRTIHELPREGPRSTRSNRSEASSSVSSGYRRSTRFPLRPPRMSDIEDTYADICH